jgi:hypothetical protein
MSALRRVPGDLQSRPPLQSAAQSVCSAFSKKRDTKTGNDLLPHKPHKASTRAIVPGRSEPHPTNALRPEAECHHGKSTIGDDTRRARARAMKARGLARPSDGKSRDGPTPDASAVAGNGFHDGGVHRGRGVGRLVGESLRMPLSGAAGSASKLRTRLRPGWDGRRISPARTAATTG